MPNLPRARPKEAHQAGSPRRPSSRPEKTLRSDPGLAAPSSSSVDNDIVVDHQQGFGRDDEIARLVHRLVACVDKAETGGLDESEGDRVLLNWQGDGVRCVLVRTPRRDAALEVSLTPREREIARMVAKGYPNKTIASVLDISSWTVGTHLRRIFVKLRVSSRAAMVARLLEEGLIHQRTGRS